MWSTWACDNISYMDVQDIDPADHATLDALGPTAQRDGQGGRTLADMIFSQMQGGAVTQGEEEESQLIISDFARITKLTFRR